MPFKNKHPLYQTWQNMKWRCLNPKLPNYPDYGGRGITVCERWIHSFPHFLEDMGNRPMGMSIDRIDNDGPYSPENCRWATRTVQSRNQRSTRYVDINGTRYKASDLAESHGIKADTIVSRAALGLSFAEITNPSPRMYEIKKHSGDPAGVAKRVANSRNRAQCKNGHQWPEFQKINSNGAVVCTVCERDKITRYRAKRNA